MATFMNLSYPSDVIYSYKRGGDNGYGGGLLRVTSNK